MITIHARRNGRFVAEAHDPALPLPADALWIDLLEPTAEDERLVEVTEGFDVPTRDEMAEIELSSRLYRRNGTLFMTVSVIVDALGPRPENAAVTFILTSSRLITVRYASPRPFVIFTTRATDDPGVAQSATTMLFGLLEAVVDRVADILEDADAQFDTVSHQLFNPPTGRKRVNYRAVLYRLGRVGDLAARANESLMSISRLFGFLAASVGRVADADVRGMLDTLERDVQSLTDHAGLMSNKLSFLLDATLGLISMQQNDIIKIFSVVAFIFLPPTLIASIYGMNFDTMPELHWAFGYPLALVLMVVSGLGSYLFFRLRGWL